MEISDFQTPQYPPYVQTTAQRRRWDYCRANAILYSGENGRPAENTESADVWMMTRSLYHGDIPTDPPPEEHLDEAKWVEGVHPRSRAGRWILKLRLSKTSTVGVTPYLKQLDTDSPRTKFRSHPKPLPVGRDREVMRADRP